MAQSFQVTQYKCGEESGGKISLHGRGKHKICNAILLRVLSPNNCSPNYLNIIHIFIGRAFWVLAVAYDRNRQDS